MKNRDYLLFVLFFVVLMLAAIPIAAQDTQPPAVAITYPTNYGVVQVRTPVTVTVEASDDVGVWFVHCYADGKLFDYDFTYPYECLWVPTKKGNHSLFARAFDLPVGTSMNMTTSQALVVSAVR